MSEWHIHIYEKVSILSLRVFLVNDTSKFTNASFLCINNTIGMLSFGWAVQYTCFYSVSFSDISSVIYWACRLKTVQCAISIRKFRDICSSVKEEFLVPTHLWVQSMHPIQRQHCKWFRSLCESIIHSKVSIYNSDRLIIADIHFLCTFELISISLVRD